MAGLGCGGAFGQAVSRSEMSFDGIDGIINGRAVMRLSWFHVCVGPNNSAVPPSYGGPLAHDSAHALRDPPGDRRRGICLPDHLDGGRTGPVPQGAGPSALSGGKIVLPC